MKSKLMATVCLFALLFLAVTACAPAPTVAPTKAPEPTKAAAPTQAPTVAPTKAPEKVGKITIWTKYNDLSPENIRDKWMKKALEDYKAETGNDVTNVFAAYDQINSKLGVAVAAGGEVPDLAYVDTQQIFFHIANDTLMDLTDYVKNAPWAADMNPRALEGCKAPDGRILCIPLNVGTRVAFIWTQAWPNGWPKDTDAFLVEAERIKKGGKYPLTFKASEKYGIEGLFYGLTKSCGGRFNDEKGQPDWANPGTVKAAEFLRGLFVKEYVPKVALAPGFDNEVPFQNGEAMAFTGISWTYVYRYPVKAPDGTLYDKGPESMGAAIAEGKMAVVPYLSCPGSKPSAHITSSALAIPNGAKNIAGAPPAERLAAARTAISARQMAVLPGLVNGHTHLSQTFMRGLSGGRPLLRWLKELIWPLQGVMSAAEVGLAAALGLAENVRCGVTHVVDHHKITHTPAHTDAVCRAAAQAGVRMTLARAWADRGSNAEPAAGILEDLGRLFQTYHQPGRLEIANGPLTPWRCSAEMLQKTDALAGSYDAATHIHVSEARDEVQMTLNETGRRPVAWLDSLGLLHRRAQIVHAVWVEEAEMDLLAQRRATVVHCPISNMVIGSGAAPVTAMLRRGVAMRLGTDGPASNDTQDLFETLKFAISLARVTTLDPTALPPAEALRLATDGRTLEAGAPADLIMVDLNHTRAMPVHDLDSALTLCTHGSDVDTVIVAGQLLMRAKKLLRIDESALLEECRAAVTSLRQRAGVA